ncbi:MAG: heme NO-binding domain-containing protein [Candidatus Binatia bacterium]
MDGLVNKALVAVIRDRIGEPAFVAMARDAGLVAGAFVPGNVYDDAVTYRLVGAGARALGISESALLESLGEHWVEFAIREGYGGFLTTAGRTLRDVLLNLDRMHEKISLNYPHVRQPTFWCTDVTPAGFVLHYTSPRAGLSSLVMGIVRGLARMHHTHVEIEHRRRLADGAPHDEFAVRFQH